MFCISYICKYYVYSEYRPQNTQTRNTFKILFYNALNNNWTFTFISFRIQKNRKKKKKKEITHPQKHKDNKNGENIFIIIFLRLNKKISIHYKFVSLSNSAHYKKCPYPLKKAW